jgi:hypothetical protein
MHRIGFLVAAALFVVALVGAGSARAQTRLYSSYSCTLQGTHGLTYVLEGSSSSTIHGACVAFKSTLHQTELRWGLHAPSFSSGESARATWLSASLHLKLTLLAVKVPALASLVREVAAVLSTSTWRRVSTSYYP